MNRLDLNDLVLNDLHLIVKILEQVVGFESWVYPCYSNFLRFFILVRYKTWRA